MSERPATTTGPIFSRIATLLCISALFGINAYICRDLFSVEFTERMESIESSYISISRWALDHWGDLTWFPLWFTGMPLHRVYQPGLHLSVAALARAIHWTPQHAYHFVTATAYCLGPVTLFWFCYRTGGRRGYAFLVGTLYSLVSPTCFLVPAIRSDVGGLLLPRRYQVLVQYGEGPHITALAMLPAVIWLLDRAVSDRRWPFIPAAALALSALVLTNWPGAVGLSMAIAAYCLSRMGSERRMHWPALIGIGTAAYLIAAPWIPPSVVKAVLRNAQQSDNTMLGGRQLLPFALLAAVLLALHFLLRRAKADSRLRFFVYFTLITGTVSIGREWFGWRFLPQPNRFQLELEMALLGVVGYAAVLLFPRLSRRWQGAALCLFVLFCAAQVRRYRQHAASLTRPIDITTTIEYKMAKWFDSNMQGRRVFAPGNVSLWMNMFTDVSQVAGCCDQGIPTREHRIAVYAIYTGQNAGLRDAEFSLLWLKAYGANALGVTGPASTEYFKPYWNPRKFDGVLPELWREGDNVIYRVSQSSGSLAHVVAKSAVVTRAPEHGLDVAPLVPLVAALDDPKAPPARLHWLSQHEAQIDAQVGPKDVIFVQVTYDRGWRASEGGIDHKIVPDALGLMTIDPGHSGPCRIRLVYEGGSEGKLTGVLGVAGVVLLGYWTGAMWYHGSRPAPSDG